MISHYHAISAVNYGAIFAEDPTHRQVFLENSIQVEWPRSTDSIQAPWFISVISAFGRLGQEDCHGFKARLSYTLSFRPTWVTELAPGPSQKNLRTREMAQCSEHVLPFHNLVPRAHRRWLTTTSYNSNSRGSNTSTDVCEHAHTHTRWGETDRQRRRETDRKTDRERQRDSNFKD